MLVPAAFRTGPIRNGPITPGEWQSRAGPQPRWPMASPGPLFCCQQAGLHARGPVISRHIGTLSISNNSRHRLSVNLQLQRTVACKFQ